MAQTKKEETIVNIEGAYTKADSFLQENKKGLYVVLGGIALLFVGYFGYKYYNDSRNTEAQELIWKAEYYFEVDSLDKAMKGDGTHLGFQQIADEYSGTKTGKLAHYYLGICYRDKGKFQEAISHFEECDFEDENVGAIALGNIGDAYVELGKTEDGIKYFDKAVAHSDNNFTAPIYLMKAALAYEKLKNYNKALEAYQTIKDKYPNSMEGQGVEKYIAKAESFKK